MTLFALVVAVGCIFVACKDSKGAAKKALSDLQSKVDLDGLIEWATPIVNSTNPAVAFDMIGRRIPAKLMKSSAQPPPNIELFQSDTGDWFIQLDASFGLAFYGIALGRTNAQFPVGYKVYSLKPGVYYFYAAN